MHAIYAQFSCLLGLIASVVHLAPGPAMEHCETVFMSIRVMMSFIQHALFREGMRDG